MILGSGRIARCATCARPARRSGWAATGRRRPTRRRCGWRPARRCCSASCAAGPAAMTARDALEIATRGGAACLGRDGRDRRAVGRRAAATSWCGPLDGVALRRRAAPTRSRRGCAAARAARAHGRGGTGSRRGRRAHAGGRRRRPGPPPRRGRAAAERTGRLTVAPFGRESSDRTTGAGAGRCRGGRAVTAPQPRDVPSWSDPLVAATSRIVGGPLGRHALIGRPVS